MLAHSPYSVIVVSLGILTGSVFTIHALGITAIVAIGVARAKANQIVTR